MSFPRWPGFGGSLWPNLGLSYCRMELVACISRGWTWSIQTLVCGVGPGHSPHRLLQGPKKVFYFCKDCSKTLVLYVQVGFLIVMTKYGEKQLKKDLFWFLGSRGFQSHYDKKGMTESMTAKVCSCHSSHLGRARKQGTGNSDTHLVFRFYVAWPCRPWNAAGHIQDESFPSVKSLWKHPHPRDVSSR